MTADRQDRIVEGRLFAFAAAGLAAVVLTRLHVGGSPTLIAVVLGGVCLAIWHGAYDSVTARELLEASLQRRWWMAFLGGYLGLVCAGALLWRVAPGVALCLFLLYSSWHFGTEEDYQSMTPVLAVRSLAEGAVPIVAACYWHAEGVLPIFAAMLKGGSQARPQFILSLFGWAFLPVVVVAVGGTLVQGYQSRRWRDASGALVLIGAELLVFYVCAPLLAFAVYFCVWHTPQHLMGSSVDAGGNFSAEKLRMNLRSGFPFWLISIAGLAGLVYLAPGGLLGFSASLFILLSVLTVPHMLLHELRRRQLRGAARRSPGVRAGGGWSVAAGQR